MGCACSRDTAEHKGKGKSKRRKETKSHQKGGGAKGKKKKQTKKRTKDGMSPAGVVPSYDDSSQEEPVAKHSGGANISNSEAAADSSGGGPGTTPSIVSAVSTASPRHSKQRGKGKVSNSGSTMAFQLAQKREASLGKAKVYIVETWIDASQRERAKFPHGQLFDPEDRREQRQLEKKDEAASPSCTSPQEAPFTTDSTNAEEHEGTSVSAAPANPLGAGGRLERTRSRSYLGNSRLINELLALDQTRRVGLGDTGTDLSVAAQNHHQDSETITVSALGDSSKSGLGESSKSGDRHP